MFFAITNSKILRKLDQGENDVKGSLVTGLPYGKPSLEMEGVCSVLFFFFSSVSVKVLRLFKCGFCGRPWVADQRFSLKQWFARGAQSRGLRKPGCGHCYLRFFGFCSDLHVGVDGIPDHCGVAN